MSVGGGAGRRGVACHARSNAQVIDALRGVGREVLKGEAGALARCGMQPLRDVVVQHARKALAQGQVRMRAEDGREHVAGAWCLWLLTAHSQKTKQTHIF